MRIFTIFIIGMAARTLCMEKNQPTVFEIACSDGTVVIERGEETDNKVKLIVHLLGKQNQYATLLDETDALKPGNHPIDLSSSLTKKAVEQFAQSGDTTRLLKNTVRKKQYHHNRGI